MDMRMHRALVPGLVLLGLVTMAAQPGYAQKGDRNKLTVEEIAEQGDIANALDAIKRLRSNWLRVSWEMWAEIWLSAMRGASFLQDGR